MSDLDQTHLASLFEGSPATICILRGPDLVIALANAACLRVWGKSAAVIGKPLLVALPELRGQGFDALLRDVMTRGVVRSGDEVLARLARDAGGALEDVYFDFYYAPMRAADGTVEGVFVHGYEVTERVLARHKVSGHEEASRFRLLVESVKDYAIFMLDPTGHVATWNAGAQRLKGYAATEIIGKHFSTFYPAEDIAAGKCEMELEGATRDGRFEDESWRLRKDGSRFWANVVITALHANDGTLVGFAKVTRDLTERKLNEEKLRQLAAEKAAFVEKARTQEFQERFLAILGHDLRNPLAAIDMGAALLRQRAAGDPVTLRILDRTSSSSRRMSRMIEQILDLTRSRLSGGLEMNPAQMDLVATLRAIADELCTAHPSRAIELRSDGTCVGEWDPDRLEQVFSNLIGNAIAYGSPTRPVTVDAREADGAIVVDVHNDGVPIPEAVRETIFDPFRRGEKESRAKQTEGLGLGLYISREIVVAHGGSIEAQSSEAGGTTFRVILPRSARRQASP